MTWRRTPGRQPFLLEEDPAAEKNSRSRIFGLSRELIVAWAGCSPSTYRMARKAGDVDEDDPWDVLRWVLQQRAQRAGTEPADAAKRARQAVAKIRKILASF